MDASRTQGTSPSPREVRRRQAFLGKWRDRLNWVEDMYRDMGVWYHRISYAVRSMPLVPQDVLGRLSQAFVVEQATRAGAGYPRIEDLDVVYAPQWPEVERLMDELEVNIHAQEPPNHRLMTASVRGARANVLQLQDDLLVLQDVWDSLTSAGCANNAVQRAEQERIARWWMVVRLPEVRRAVRNGMTWHDATKMTFSDTVDDESRGQDATNGPILLTDDLPEEPDWEEDGISVDGMGNPIGEGADIMDEAADPDHANAAAEAAPNGNAEPRADLTYVTLDDLIRVDADFPDLTPTQQRRVAWTINRRLEELRRERGR